MADKARNAADVLQTTAVNYPVYPEVSSLYPGRQTAFPLLSTTFTGFKSCFARRQILHLSVAVLCYIDKFFPSDISNYVEKRGRSKV